MVARIALLLVMTALPASAETLFITVDGGVTVRAEVARTAAARERGLSGRSALATDAGMWFVFSPPRRVCMWMKGTPLPLAVAFVSAAGLVSKVAEMQPDSTALHCSDDDVPYALETHPQLVEDGILKVGAQLGGY